MISPKMKDLKHPAKSSFENQSDVDETILRNEESDEEDYHPMLCKTMVYVTIVQ